MATDREKGTPQFKTVSMKIAALERRRTYLEKQVGNRQGSEGSLEYMRAEVAALAAAQLALTFHKNVVERLDEPLAVLKDVISAYDGPAGSEARLRAAINRARAVCEEFDALMEKSL
ncbi:hypothetical protein UFOVP650_8 [uncultured Caudovirales phage]|uniref:Uncharacterized protein n=1 Tax=uncultured Caudovirales phage TaxID=2100421 RepID=A0A6J5NBU2_9CAUD|nr:hypothetical protein UFOVP650_8 [uncultured Caudovirales phage]